MTYSESNQDKVSRLQKQSEEQLKKRINRIQSQMVDAYDQGDDEKYRELCQKDGEAIAALMFKTIYDK